MTLSYDLRENLREEIILPEQFFPPVHFKNQCRGKVALLYAVLEDAVRCLQGRQGGKEWKNQAQIVQEAETWLFVDDYEWPFSFVNICEQLGLDPAYLRRGLECRRSLRRSISKDKKPMFSPLESLLKDSANQQVHINFSHERHTLVTKTPNTGDFVSSTGRQHRGSE
jgi:hypothetical protein